MEMCLDRPPKLRSGDALPLLWHWIFFVDPVPTSELANDGHETLGRFLPSVRYPRRMWAGGDVTFRAPLLIGRPANKTSRIEDVTFKHGSTGPLCFVTVRHRVVQDRTEAIDEIQTIVYRDVPDATESGHLPANSDRVHDGMISVGRLQLFRYSALMFNAHRIHYDERFTMDTEGYPGLIVQGPLLATLLADYGAGLRPERSVQRYRYRAVGPVFENEGFRFEHDARPDGADLRILKSQQVPAMRANLDWAE